MFLHHAHHAHTSWGRWDLIERVRRFTACLISFSRVVYQVVRALRSHGHFESTNAYSWPSGQDFQQVSLPWLTASTRSSWHLMHQADQLYVVRSTQTRNVWLTGVRPTEAKQCLRISSTASQSAVPQCGDPHWYILAVMSQSSIAHVEISSRSRSVASCRQPPSSYLHHVLATWSWPGKDLISSPTIGVQQHNYIVGLRMSSCDGTGPQEFGGLAYILGIVSQCQAWVEVIYCGFESLATHTFQSLQVFASQNDHSVKDFGSWLMQFHINTFNWGLLQFYNISYSC